MGVRGCRRTSTAAEWEGSGCRGGQVGGFRSHSGLKRPASATRFDRPHSGVNRAHLPPPPPERSLPAAFAANRPGRRRRQHPSPLRIQHPAVGCSTLAAPAATPARAASSNSDRSPTPRQARRGTRRPLRSGCGPRRRVAPGSRPRAPSRHRGAGRVGGHDRRPRALPQQRLGGRQRAVARVRAALDRRAARPEPQRALGLGQVRRDEVGCGVERAQQRRARRVDHRPRRPPRARSPSSRP